MLISACKGLFLCEVVQPAKASVQPVKAQPAKAQPAKACVRGAQPVLIRADWIMCAVTLRADFTVTLTSRLPPQNRSVAGYFALTSRRLHADYPPKKKQVRCGLL